MRAIRVEIRNNKITIDGYVNAVARDSRPIPSERGPFIEQIKPKTFQRALESTDNVDLLFNHRRKLGSTKDGNLKLYEDNIGLRATAIVEDEEVIEKAKNGELRGWSFGFRTLKDKWEENKRYLEEIDLLEVSILDKTPAYIATSIEARDNSLIERRSEDSQIEVVEDNKEEVVEDIENEEEQHVCEECASRSEEEEKRNQNNLLVKEIEILKMKGEK